MVLSGGYDPLSAGELDLERAAGGRALRVEILRADPAGQAVPLARPKVDFLSQCGIGRFVGGIRSDCRPSCRTVASAAIFGRGRTRGDSILDMARPIQTRR